MVRFRKTAIAAVALSALVAIGSCLRRLTRHGVAASSEDTMTWAYYAGADRLHADHSRHVQGRQSVSGHDRHGWQKLL